jgi:hypothetical protein
MSAAAHTTRVTVESLSAPVAAALGSKYSLPQHSLIEGEAITIIPGTPV